MCCLRYEHETYEDAIRRTPSQGSIVQTKDGQGVVVETKPLAEEIRVKFTDKEKEIVKTYKCADVKVISKKKPVQSKDDDSEEIPAED
jgi:cell fate regulator YaaT (PSP1 superfamily)